MEEAEHLEDFKYNLVFNNIYHIIMRRKRNLSENSKIYIDLAKELFQNVTKSLDSILDTSKDSSYHFTPHLKEIIECAGKDTSKMSSQEIIKVKEKVSSIINNLDNLKKDPHKFYGTKDSKEILSLSDKLISIYEIKAYPILS